MGRFVVFAQWVILGAAVGVLCGLASAGFLWSLDQVTTFRLAHEWLVFGLPFAGLAVGAIYERFGKPIAGGNNLVIDTIHDDGPEIPLRLAPMVLLGTLATHLFGGSAGREGTAVQMGASLTDWLSHRLKVSTPVRTDLLVAGVAGGFGSVFGTPLAGAMFGLEFVVLGRFQYRALVPALVAAWVGDLVTRGVGIVHTPYPHVAGLELTVLVVGKWALFAIGVAVTTVAFIELTHFLKRQGEQRVKRLPVRMFFGGLAVIALWQALGSDSLGLGVPMIVRSFTDASLPQYAFAAKLVFTAVTIGAGFLGGEVTPLFFVGAALGNALARALGLPIEMGAAVGMAAVFGAASNAPIALSLMAVELVGMAVAPHVAVVCAIAYALVGKRSIYPSQRAVVGDARVRLKELRPPERSKQA